MRETPPLAPVHQLRLVEGGDTDAQELRTDGLPVDPGLLLRFVHAVHEAAGPGQSADDLLQEVTRTLESRDRLRHDYAADWNAMAEKYDWPKIIRITDGRRRHLKARESETAWDWPAILNDLEEADHRYLAGETWWSFDYLIRNGDGYVRLLEGRYRPRSKEAGDVYDSII